MKFAIFGKILQKESLPYVQRLVNELEREDCGILIYEPFFNEISTEVKFNGPFSLFYHHESLVDKADVLLSVGGDGTLLDTITLVRDSGIPVLGINIGKLGFLSSIPKEKIIDAIQQILRGNYSLDPRSLLRLETGTPLFGDISYAMNDLTVYKKSPLSMLVIHTYINNDFLNSYWADGLIVATPTGSTAYSMSCNGPILTPDCRNFVITPIASHNLTVRPIVIPDDAVIRIKVECRSNEFYIGLDSRSILTNTNIELTIRKESFHVKLLKPEGKDFFGTIRDKLNWGLDVRN